MTPNFLIFMLMMMQLYGIVFDNTYAQALSVAGMLGILLGHILFYTFGGTHATF